MFKHSSALGFVCDSCGAEYDIREKLTLCPKCGGLMEVKYSITELKKSADLFKEYIPGSIWRYRNFYPQISDESIVSLGEGGTPLLKSKYIGPSLGIENLYFKNDTMMPTGSFKDRGFSLAVSYAIDIGVERGLTYSSGNAGISFSAYCARSGFPGVVLVEDRASALKKTLIMLYGANTAILEFDNFSDIEKMLDEAINKLGCYTFVNFINPIRHEAMKTYAYEIYTELGKAPDYTFHPVGTGGGLWGTWKGYNELAEIGVTDKLPHMMAVQSKEVCWLKQAVDSGAQKAQKYGDSSKTIAQSISGNSPLQGGIRLLKAVRDSSGGAFGVGDDEIMQAMLELGKEGIAAEASSASTVAAFKQAVKEGKIKSSDTVVCVITGAAYKQPSVLERIASNPKYTIRADFEHLKKLLSELNLL